MSNDRGYRTSLSKSTPVGFSAFPYEILQMPRAFLEASYNLVQYRRHNSGGFVHRAILSFSRTAGCRAESYFRAATLRPSTIPKPISTTSGRCSGRIFPEPAALFCLVCALISIAA